MLDSLYFEIWDTVITSIPFEEDNINSQAANTPSPVNWRKSQIACLKFNTSASKKHSQREQVVHFC